MELLKKYYRKLFLFLIIVNITLKAQVNCNTFDNENCKKACELVNLAEPYQGYKQSQIAFDKAIKLCPNFDYAYREKSVPYLKRGDFITWKELIDKAVELNPKNNLAYRGWCKYQFLRDYRAALDDFEAFEKLVGEDYIEYSQNGNYSLKIVKALCYKMIGDTNRAINLIEKQISRKDYTPLLFDFYHLGVLYYEIGNYDKAKEYFDKQIRNNDYYAEPYYFLALIYNRLDDKKQAKLLISKALSYYSDGKFMQDPYTSIMDKVYKKEMKIFQNYLAN
ncbi:tetratricopeptide repeat protein [Chryseobacterium sp.]|uniref:tetratricopeptide repeat protein n=1 Tax=Chryseobacterium sp. TaxID=1871047 RepID=UPI00289DE213|nr:tetratricopeptide repeat protein [Chryseobacterium sp.]